MATGDKPNQNLFGTSDNAEEEERKKAELAAQGAMMGANIPASAFGQAPAVAPFSMEAAGQVNPMMQPQNLESFAQPQVTFRDYDVPATPPASALSVFTPGGEVKPNVDVNAITPSPETTSTSAVNTALNQEVAVDLPNVESPEESVRLARSRRPRTGESSQNVVLDFLSNTDYVGTRTGRGRGRRDDNIDTQAPSGASALGATPSVTPPVETPSEGAQGQTAALDPTSDEAILARRAEREAQFAPTGGLTTVGGASLSEFLSGQAMPEQGFTEAESPLGGRGVTLTQDQMNQLSAERESRIGADQAISDRDRRAARGDGISMADQVDMAKANARGATPREVARGNQVANALGVDLKTGQPLQATGGLTFDQIMKLEEFDFKRGQEAYKRSQDDLIAQGKKTEAFEQDSALLRQVSGDAGRIGRLTNEAIGLTTEPGTTALSGSLLKLLPGSNANQLEAVLEVLQSKVALDRLMEVKKTGATLGQVSEKELAMLQNSYDALKQGLKPERLREALTNYANQLKKVEDQTQRAFIDKHGQEKFNKIMGGGSTGQGEPRYANDQNVGDSVDTYYNPSK